MNVTTSTTPLNFQTFQNPLDCSRLSDRIFKKLHCYFRDPSRVALPTIEQLEKRFKEEKDLFNKARDLFQKHTDLSEKKLERIEDLISAEEWLDCVVYQEGTVW